MSRITLTVGGRAFPVTCADGEESHVRQLAAVVDSKLTGSANDAQNLLFAALILADEADEARRSAPPMTPARPHAQTDETRLAQITAIAQRIESLAEMLEKHAART